MTCHKTKPDKKKPYGKLQPINPPEKPWSTIAFDLIVKLPLSKEPMTKAGYDSIWVIADKLTKFTYFLLFKEAASASDLAYTFLRNVVIQYGLPKRIITDRAPVYASKFWQTLMKNL